MYVDGGSLAGTDLEKAFDSIDHGILIIKIYGYSFDTRSSFSFIRI